MSELGGRHAVQVAHHDAAHCWLDPAVRREVVRRVSDLQPEVGRVPWLHGLHVVQIGASELLQPGPGHARTHGLSRQALVRHAKLVVEVA